MVGTIDDVLHEALARGVVVPSVGDGVGGRLWVRREKVVDRFHGVIRHPNELAVRGRGRYVLRNMAADGCRVVAQPKRKRRRGERLSTDELGHGVGEAEGKSTQVLPGWMGPQVDGKLVLQPPKVEVEKLVVPGGVGLRGVQLQLLESLGDGVEAGGGRKLDGGRSSL